jgi:acetolactate synthase-1/3 small subunit
MRHVLIAEVEDHPGVLNRVASLFRKRGFNIESLAVGHSHKPGISRMTIVVDEDARDAAQVLKQLDKLIEVIRALDVTDDRKVAREMALIKVELPPEKRVEVLDIANIYRAHVVDVSPDSVILEVTGEEDKIDALVEILKPYGILELSRTGMVAMVRGRNGIVAP